MLGVLDILHQILTDSVGVHMEEVSWLLIPTIIRPDVGYCHVSWSVSPLVTSIVYSLVAIVFGPLSQDVRKCFSTQEVCERTIFLFLKCYVIAVTFVHRANRSMGLLLHCSMSASHDSATGTVSVGAFRAAQIADGLGLNSIKPRHAR